MTWECLVSICHSFFFLSQTYILPADHSNMFVILTKYAHIQYIIASLLHWNIKVYIFITILERKDQVKKTTCRLSRSSFLVVIRKKERQTDRKKERFGVRNRKATVTGCHRFCAHIRNEGKQPYMLPHIQTHIHTFYLPSPVRTFHWLHSLNPVPNFTLHLLPKKKKKAPETSGAHQVILSVFGVWCDQHNCFTRFPEAAQKCLSQKSQKICFFSPRRQNY